MSPWNQGLSTMTELIDEGRLVRLHGADVGVAALMVRARQELASANTLLMADPQTAYVVAYDAAKHAGMALLAEQNLRSAYDPLGADDFADVTEVRRALSDVGDIVDRAQTLIDQGVLTIF